MIFVKIKMIVMIVRYLSSVDCETTSLLLGKTLVHDRIGLDASDE